ncbi:MASE3 domain-containing protein [Clostridium manihotivorum]|uniref:histidine kinase n=1 Tax=Clostridium manihotivorum TaxID=2320868 RepID=A0A410E0N3_9CLOT|nr:MASE3 domain-containing protein [Clostridium manihotivorum]QAA34861.1 histidine kinase [Clostridium manihotivorum]
MNNLCKTKNYAIYKTIFTYIIYSVLISLILAFIIWKGYWGEDKEIIHSILEIITAVVGVAIFLIVWYQIEMENEVNIILGFGFLIVAILDLIHAHYYKYLIINDIINSNLTARYWMLARLIQMMTLLIFSYKPFKKNNNRYLGLIITISSGIIVFYICRLGYWDIPVLYDEKGITFFKVLLELLVIGLALFTLKKLSGRLEENYLIRFTYIFLCVAMIIPSEACLALYKDINSFFMVLGHILKIVSYYFLYKGVFSSVIRYPYVRMMETNQRLADILNAVPMPIHTYDNNNKIDFVNDKFVELFKCSKEKIVGIGDNKLLEILPRLGDEKEDTIANIVRKCEKGATNLIRTYINGDKELVRVIVNAHKIKNGVLVLLKDVKQEQEIDNLHLQTQVILNSISAPVMILDANEKITAYNEHYGDLFEVQSRSLIGLSLEEFKKSVGFNETSFSEVLEAGKVVGKRYEGSIFFKDNLEREIGGTCSVIRNIDDEKIGAVCIFRDITQEKEKQQKLINQEKLATIGQMGATIIHETRNFLTTIKGSSQLIELYANDVRIKEYAKKINISTDEVNRIISGFLSLSKPKETEFLEVAFIDLIESMRGILETSSLMRGVELILDLKYDERYILCDETQIRQVMLNICKNAVEAMDNSLHPVLLIKSGIREANKEIFISISDNGDGIPKDMVKKLGTPFLSTKKNGTGLGLSACFNIIDEHRGRIEVESELGIGTTFTIIIPYIEEDLDDIV